MNSSAKAAARWSNTETAERERRLGRLAAMAGLGSVAVTLFAILIGASGALHGPEPGVTPSDTQSLHGIYVSAHDQLIGNAARGVGLVLSAGVGLFLYDAARRRGASLGKWFIPVLCVGTVLYAADFWIGYGIVHHAAVRYHDAHLTGKAASKYASHLLHTGVARWLPLIDILLRVSFGAWLLIIAYYTFLVGLLSRALAIWGAGSGLAIPFLAGGDTIFLGWILVVSSLIAGYWPGGRPPAWDTFPRLSLQARMAK
ncbi:MAG TPA: hypothetical protein VHX88_16555 [Solirubrobacteraceae bacterium]|nr:hypothetical protein [Solirubrobacteraceae bacterium]